MFSFPDRQDARLELFCNIKLSGLRITFLRFTVMQSCLTPHTTFTVIIGWAFWPQQYFNTIQGCRIWRIPLLSLIEKAFFRAGPDEFSFQVEGVFSRRAWIGWIFYHQARNFRALCRSSKFLSNSFFDFFNCFFVLLFARIYLDGQLRIKRVHESSHFFNKGFFRSKMWCGGLESCNWNDEIFTIDYFYYDS